MRVDRERRELTVDDDLVDAVTVVVHRPTRPRGPGLLLTHGAGKDLDAPHLVSLADAVAAQGVLVVRANQPWKQSGRAAPPRPHRAVGGYAAVAAAVRTAFGPRRGWVVGGHSNGARLTTHALADAELDIAAPWSDNTVIDGLLITGQNPQSSASAARALIAALS